MKRFTLQLALAFAAGALTLSATSINLTLGEFNGVDTRSGFPSPAVAVGTFTYTIPTGEHIVSANFSSTFGNSAISNTAGVDVFVGGIEVGSCAPLASCDTASVVTPFAYTFTAANFSTLSSGSLNVTAVQQSGNVIRLGTESLNISTTTNTPSSTPEPASVAMLGVGLAGLAWVRGRKGQVRD